MFALLVNVMWQMSPDR